MDDRGLYASGQLWLRKKDVVGRARGLVHGLFIDIFFPYMYYFVLKFILKEAINIIR